MSYNRIISQFRANGNHKYARRWILQNVHANAHSGSIIILNGIEGREFYGKNDPHRGRRPQYLRTGPDVSGKGRISYKDRRRRRPGRGPVPPGAAGSGAARYHAACDGRLERTAHHPAGQPDPRHHAHRQGRDERQGAGPEAGRRRLSDEALRDEGAAGQSRGGPPPRGRGRGEGQAAPAGL